MTTRPGMARRGVLRKPASPSAFARWSILSLALTALALGGATELWEQAALVLLGGLLILLAPPRRSPGMVPFVLFGALFLLALGAFLPAAWSSLPWRAGLAGNPAVLLPGTRTPQPWITAQACCLLFVGLTWTGYILGQAWDRAARFRTAQALVLGVTLLAAVMTAAYCFDFHVPNWDQQENRGWFPNRNQTADVLAVCGVVNYVLLFDAVRKRRLAAYIWCGSLACIGAGLVVSYSRAGILMFFGGIALWHLWPVRNRRKGRGSAKWTTLSLALVFVLLTAFFLLGGDTLARFEGEGRTVDSGDFRLAIQKDALRFSGEAPLLGVGLGNFEPLFASAQRDSVNESRAIHPESDWLWAACELGWGAPAIFIAGIAWWLRRCLPFRQKSGESLRRGVTVAAILFLLHGLVDVSGHRMGSLWIGLLLAGMALPRTATITAARQKSRRAQAWLFRGAGAALVLIAGWWIASIEGAPVPPTTADLARIESGVQRAIAGGDLKTARDLADAGLRIAPVNWQLYFQRGYAEAFLPGQLARAGADFLVARQLEAQWVKPCFDEGAVWIAANEPDLCLEAWREGLRRAGIAAAPNSPKDLPEERSVLHDAYKEMLVLARDQPEVHAALMELGRGRLDLELIFLHYATPEEMKKVTGDIVAGDPDLRRLSTEERGRFFDDWWDHGDRTELLARIGSNPAWLQTGWVYLAEAYAGQKDYQHAWETVARYAPQPAEPSSATNLPEVDLERAFQDRDDNVATGIMLYLSQSRAGKTDNALGTLRALEQLKDCPKYVYYEEARLWASKQQWELAWEAWENYRKT